MNLAQRLFRQRKQDGKAKKEIEKRLKELNVPYDRIGWDSYDCSLELYGVDPDYRFSEEAQRFGHEAGFATIFVNHTDGWETHYGWKFGSEFKFHEGSRISYPNKRKHHQDLGIWVEEFPQGWPEEWAKTGYVKIINKKR